MNRMNRLQRFGSAGFLLPLLLVLVLMQSLGLCHRIVHAGVGRAVLQASAAQPASAFWQDLFAGHDDDQGCRLFDQALSQDGAPTSGVWVAVPVACPLGLGTDVASAPHAFHGVYQSRAPPVSV